MTMLTWVKKEVRPCLEPEKNSGLATLGSDVLSLLEGVGDPLGCSERAVTRCSRVALAVLIASLAALISSLVALMRLFSSISAARLASRAASLLVWVDDVVDMLISKLIFECQRLRLIQSANLDQKIYCYDRTLERSTKRSGVRTHKSGRGNCGMNRLGA
jgi:hypothetical protein